MRTIYKYTVNPGDNRTVVVIPYGANLVLVDQQFGIPCLWFEVDTEEPTTTRSFCVHGTGHKIGDMEKHIGSCICRGFVWHIYEVGAFIRDNTRR